MSNKKYIYNARQAMFYINHGAKVLDVNIPGERNHSMLVKPEFLELKHHIMEMLWAESEDAAMGR